MGDSIVGVRNTFQLDESISGSASSGYGMQEIQISILFAPTSDPVGDGDGEKAPLTFGDMLADEAGVQAAVAAAIAANVKVRKRLTESHRTASQSGTALRASGKCCVDFCPRRREPAAGHTGILTTTRLHAGGRCPGGGAL